MDGQVGHCTSEEAVMSRDAGTFPDVDKGSESASRGWEALDRGFDDMLERMQSPEHRAAVDRLFAMTGEELGRAAARVARCMVREHGAAGEGHRDDERGAPR